MSTDDLANLPTLLDGLRDATWLTEAACGTAWRVGDEFVDVDQETGEQLVAAYCWRCPVLDDCGEYGDNLGRSKFSVIYGGEWRPRHESGAIRERRRRERQRRRGRAS